MPRYDYKCDACGHTFERQQKMSDDPVKKCPECGEPVRRLIGAVAGFVRGGSGPLPACDRPVRCCGRETPCDNSPCRDA